MKMHEGIFGKQFTEVAVDETKRFIIRTEYDEFWFPIGTIMGKQEIGMDLSSGGLKLSLTEPITTTVPVTIRDIMPLKIIANLKELIGDVKENFSDIPNRQIFFFRFKEKVNELWRVSEGKMKDISLDLEYAIENLKSEKLTKKKVMALETAINTLEEKGEEGEEKIWKTLVDAGISTVPKIGGLAEMYVKDGEL